MTKKLIIILMMLLTLLAFSQDKNNQCKVLLKAISQSYKGKCLNGLAEGKGEARGEDKYIGYFHEGLPEGKGKYIFKNENIFEGNWKIGKKEGSGKFTFLVGENEIVQEGFWINDEYVGLSDPKSFFNASNIVNITDYSFNKKEESSKINKLKISIYDNNVIFVPQKFEIETSSGTKLPNLKYYEIHNFSLPLYCEIRYSIFTTGGERACRFSFEITQSGNYDLQIIN